jgi:hypothetical protein
MTDEPTIEEELLADEPETEDELDARVEELAAAQPAEIAADFDTQSELQREADTNE